MNNRTIHRALPKNRAAAAPDTTRFTITAKGLNALAAAGSPIESAFEPLLALQWPQNPLYRAGRAMPKPCKACGTLPGLHSVLCVRCEELKRETDAAAWNDEGDNHADGMVAGEF